jgi:hypothetical protein
MPTLPIHPPEEPIRDSVFETIFLKFVVTFLSTLFGFVLVILSYGYTYLFDLDSEEFSMYTFVYFSISLAIWFTIGLITPYAQFQGFLEELRGSTFERTIVLIVGIGIFIVLYWYILTFVAEIIVSVFGIE